MAAITPQTIASNFFRLAAWLYLRVIPDPFAPIGILGLYALHLVTWYTEKVPEEGPVSVKVVEMNGDADKTPNGHQNGHVTSESMTVTRVVHNPHPIPVQMLFSLPSKSSFVRVGSLVINTLLLCMTLDFTFRPHLLDNNYDDVTFARVVAVHPESVKIHIRYPNLVEDTPNSGAGTLKVLLRDAATGLTDSTVGMWKDGGLVKLSEDQDWVGVVTLSGLWPSTSYQVQLALPNSTIIPCASEPLTFKTFPDPRLNSGTRFKFIASSEVAMNFPYTPFASDNFIRGFDLLANQLFPSIASGIGTSPLTAAEPVPQAEPHAAHPHHEPHVVVQSPPGELPDPAPAAQEYLTKTMKIPSETPIMKTKVEVEPTPAPATLIPSFMILLGDLLEAKIPVPLNQTQIDYKKAFRRLYASHSFKKIYERIPVFTSLGAKAVEGGIKADAVSASSIYNDQGSYAAPATSHYEFKYGDSAFFVLDTESHKSGLLHEDEVEHTILGAKQATDLVNWAVKVNRTATFKFIISPTPLSSLWGPEDSWASYSTERSKIIDVLSYVPNVFVLSGSRHEFAAIEYLGGKIHEFNVGPLNDYAVPHAMFTKLRDQNSKVIEVRSNVTVPLTGSVSENPEVVELIDRFPEEKILKTVHRGNHKWMTVEVDTTDQIHPMATFELFVDGDLVWSHNIKGRHVPLTASSAIGMVLAKDLLSLLGLIKLNPISWITGR